MVKINLAELGQAEHDALEPLPIVVDAAYLYELRQKASELDYLLLRLLRFGKQSELPHVIESLKDGAPSTILRVRNALFLKHARALEALAQRAVRSKRFADAADHLSDAYDSLKKCDFVRVKCLFTHEEWAHQLGREFMEGEWAYRLHRRRLEVVKLGLLKKRTSFDRSRLLQHLFAVAIRLVEHDHVNESERVDTIAAYVAEVWSPASEQREAIRAAVAELIKAIVYGVAANGLWHLYHMYSTMNPHAMHQTYVKIYEEVSDIVRVRLPPDARVALAYGSEEFAALQAAGFEEFSNSRRR